MPSYNIYVGVSPHMLFSSIFGVISWAPFIFCVNRSTAAPFTRTQQQMTALHNNQFFKVFGGVIGSCFQPFRNFFFLIWIPHWRIDEILLGDRSRDTMTTQAVISGLRVQKEHAIKEGNLQFHSNQQIELLRLRVYYILIVAVFLIFISTVCPPVKDRSSRSYIIITCSKRSMV